MRETRQLKVSEILSLRLMELIGRGGGGSGVLDSGAGVPECTGGTLLQWGSLGASLGEGWKIRPRNGEGFPKIFWTLTLHSVGTLILFILIHHQKCTGCLLGAQGPRCLGIQ